MIAHYTAAAVTSEIRSKSHPATTDVAIVSANKEDHASMGLLAARKVRDIVGLLSKVVGIELICAAQALDVLGSELMPGDGVVD